jgi:hypothetical protein
MEFIDVINWVKEAWVGIVGTGLISVAGVKWFVLDNIKLKKSQIMQIDGEQKWLNRLNFVATETNEIKAEFKKVMGYVDVLLKEGQVKDNQINILSNLIVETLAVANVPLAQKEKFYSALTKTAVLSEQTLDMFKSVVEQTKDLETQKSITTNDNLEKLRNEV